MLGRLCSAMRNGRILIGLSLLILTVFNMTGCGGGGGNSNTVPSGSSSTGGTSGSGSTVGPSPSPGSSAAFLDNSVNSIPNLYTGPFSAPQAVTFNTRDGQSVTVMAFPGQVIVAAAQASTPASAIAS